MILKHQYKLWKKNPYIDIELQRNLLDFTFIHTDNNSNIATTIRLIDI